MMGRPKDERYWNQVSREVSGMLKCKNCGHKFKGGVTRIKAHVDRKPGQGVRPCSIDPSSIPNNAEIDHIIDVGSSNSQGAVNAVDSLQVAGGAHQMVDADLVGSWNLPSDYELSNLLYGLTVPAMMGSENRGVESEISDLKQSVDELTGEEEDIKEQLQMLKSCGKKHKIEVDGWLKKAGELRERARGDLTVISGLERQQLTKEVRTCKEERPLILSKEWMGFHFKKNIDKVWKLLGDDKVFKIGVHGMGGIGKTCLVALIEDEITRRCSFNFRHVFWVTASRGVGNYELQSLIAKRIGMKLDEDDERTRAKILSAELMRKEKSLFILDNVWSYIDTRKLGIPLEIKGNKLILTSRLKHVCRQMDCHIIQMKLLFNYCGYDDDRNESWELFLLKLGFHDTPSTFPPKVLEIARSVAYECGGLPLGISVMARSMKGVSDIHRWRHTVNKLENSKAREEMEEEVFKILKLSYDNLVDPSPQECLLYCTLLTGFYFRRKNLIMYLVEEGLINGRRSLEEIFDEGNAILDKLVDHSLLLENNYDKSLLRIHGMMRNIACHILEGRGSRHMFKCGRPSEKIPDTQEWTADLEKVSLMDKQITEIPEGTYPYCPKLTTLIFGHDSFKSFPDCFFSHMHNLTILHLSYISNLESLPSSLANLRSLISLLIMDCGSLKNVPPLGQLQKLSRLVIYGTSIVEVPLGLETIINLKWLDLSRNHHLTFRTGFVLSSLTNMQYLDLRSEKVEVKIEDIQAMSMLEYFGGCFQDSNNYTDFVSYSMRKDFRPKSYDILCGVFEDIDISTCELHSEVTKTVSLGDCEELPHLLPTDLTELYITENEQWRCLCPIGYCSDYCSLYTCHLQFPQDKGRLFYHLKCIVIKRCHKMEKLLTPVALEQLQNLELLFVMACNSMKEIFPRGSSDDDGDDYSTITLPKLTSLRLYGLPQLKTLFNGILVCGSSEVLSISSCDSLERLPTIQVFSNSDSDEVY